MFDTEQFIADCRAALAADRGGSRAIREVVARAVSNPAALMRALGEPRRAGLNVLHHSADLTVLNLVWGPMMTVMPHDRRMAALIGIYTGREDNVFWRRVGAEEGGGAGRIEAAGAKALSARECAALGRDIVHSVTNPIPRLTGAIHVYWGADFFGIAKSEWDPETLRERPYDKEKVARLFEESNAGLASARP
jgi:predicted metal-dependent enzyme (double-stranded beta helix superfamily)